MGKASDKDLGELHGALAKSMLSALAASNTAIDLLEEHKDDLPGDVQTYLSEQAKANPALLTAVAKFLKDNSITCAIEDDNQLSELEQMLKEKKRKRIGNVVHLEDPE